MVWSDDRSAAVTGTDIYAQHVLRSGTHRPGLAGERRSVDAGPGNDQVPGGGLGRIRRRVRGLDRGANGTPDRPAHARQRDGGPAWPPNGLAVATTGSFLPQITPDGAHGAYVVWSDFRSNKRACIHHLLSRRGRPCAWPTNGIFHRQGGPAIPLNPEVCSDGRAGPSSPGTTLALPWTDQHLRAARVCFGVAAVGIRVEYRQALPPVGRGWLGSGSGFFVFGIEMSFGAQSNPIVPDGAGGCFITWGDGRNFAVSSSGRLRAAT